MQTTTTVGLDIAKSVFQVHGVDADGNVVVRRQLKRRYVLTFFKKLPPCLGRRGVEQLLKVVADANDTRLPEIARACVAAVLSFARAIWAASSSKSFVWSCGTKIETFSLWWDKAT